MSHHLVGVAEVAEMLGVSRQRVHQLLALPHFPKPDADLSAGKVWTRDAVEAWRSDRQRLAAGRLRTCSFCGKSDSAVLKLVAGPAGIEICNECIDLAAEIVLQECDGEGLIRVPAYYFKHGKRR